MSVATSAQTSATAQTAMEFIDTDVHNVLPSPEALRKYLPARWHKEYYGGVAPSKASTKVEPTNFSPDQVHASGVYLSGNGRVRSGMYTNSRPNHGPYRWDTRPPTGGLPGTDFDFMMSDYFDAWPVRRAILAPLEGANWPQSGALGAALFSALNDWMAAEWVSRDPRIFGCISIPCEDPQRAVQEIRRMSANPRFVQVEMLVKTSDPMGHVRYWPIYEAAAAAGLPISVHVGGMGANPTLSAGWPSYHYEFHCGHAQGFQAQVISLIASGVFQEMPRLKAVMVEGGFAWIGPLMWRMDRAWRLLGKEGTSLKQLPSEVLRKHMWFTTQPIDEAENPVHFRQMLDHLDHLGIADNVMFSTDYPHWDFNSPAKTFPDIVTGDIKERIYWRNAEALFPFEPVAAVG